MTNEEIKEIMNELSDWELPRGTGGGHPSVEPYA